MGGSAVSRAILGWDKVSVGRNLMWFQSKLLGFGPRVPPRGGGGTGWGGDGESLSQLPRPIPSGHYICMESRPRMILIEFKFKRECRKLLHNLDFAHSKPRMFLEPQPLPNPISSHFLGIRCRNRRFGNRRWNQARAKRCYIKDMFTESCCIKRCWSKSAT